MLCVVNLDCRIAITQEHTIIEPVYNVIFM